MIHDQTPSAAQGFSLLELSVVLIVIGLVAGFGISLGANILSGSDRITTQQRLTNIRTALDSFVQKNGYLPCPASRADIPTDANFGVERRDPAGSACTPLLGEADPISAGAANSDQAYIGALPVITLGLPAYYAADAWGNKFLYAVSVTHIAGAASYAGMLSGTAQSATQNNITLASHASTTTDLYNGLTLVITYGTGVGQSSTITDYDGTSNIATVSPNWTVIPNNTSQYLISGGNAGTLTVRYGDRSAMSYPVTNDWQENPGAGAIYVVLSHGSNGMGGYPLNAKALATACTDNGTIDFENCDDANALFYDTTYNDGSQSTSFFDDYIIWGSNLLGRLPSPASAATAAGMGSGCPPGICENWCAICKNTPIYPAPTINYACRSSILATNPCEAQCTYAYFGAAAAIPCQ
jgi:prepilin-type N-terminal cleavage/methylation domain-containing protein